MKKRLNKRQKKRDGVLHGVKIALYLHPLYRGRADERRGYVGRKRAEKNK
jgi:hypothetical protein